MSQENSLIQIQQKRENESGDHKHTNLETVSIRILVTMGISGGERGGRGNGSLFREMTDLDLLIYLQVMSNLKLLQENHLF